MELMLLVLLVGGVSWPLVIVLCLAAAGLTWAAAQWKASEDKKKGPEELKLPGPETLSWQDFSRVRRETPIKEIGLSVRLYEAPGDYDELPHRHWGVLFGPVDTAVSARTRNMEGSVPNVVPLSPNFQKFVYQLHGQDLGAVTLMVGSMFTWYREAYVSTRARDPAEDETEALTAWAFWFMNMSARERAWIAHRIRSGEDSRFLAMHYIAYGWAREWLRSPNALRPHLLEALRIFRSMSDLMQGRLAFTPAPPPPNRLSPVVEEEDGVEDLPDGASREAGARTLQEVGIIRPQTGGTPESKFSSKK